MERERMAKKMRILMISVFIMTSVRVQAMDRHEITIAVPGIQQVFPVDMDGDSNLDLIVLHRDTDVLQVQPNRYVSVFLQRNNGYASEADARYRADIGDIILDWGDLDKDGLLELLFVRPGGIVTWHPETPDTVHEILSCVSLFSGADPERLIHWSFFRDVTGDHAGEIVMNNQYGFDIYAKDSTNRFQPISHLETFMKHELITGNSLVLQTRLPRLCVCDMNNDAVRDMVFLSGDRMDLFHTGSSIGIPADTSVRPDLRKRFAMDEIHMSMLESLAPVDVSLKAEDLDGDGFGDVILSRASRASFTSTMSQLQIYYSSGGAFGTLPDQVLMAENFYGDHYIADFNHDGRKDIALLQFPLGLVRAAKFLLTRRVKYGFDIYYQNAEGKYGDRPDHEFRFIRHSKLRNVLRPELASFIDWNGDNRLDILVNVDHLHILVFLQSAGGGFLKKPDRKLRVPVSSWHWTGDLNRDHQADLILWYPRQGQIRCLISGEQS